MRIIQNITPYGRAVEGVGIIPAGQTATVSDALAVSIVDGDNFVFADAEPETPQNEPPAREKPSKRSKSS